MPRRTKILKRWYEKYPCLSDELSDNPMAGDPMIINLVDHPKGPPYSRQDIPSLQEGRTETRRRPGG